jgi:2-polyprenyl-6-methoxyphenol hydroxylase-like FAD-dependent oxidoreductase
MTKRTTVLVVGGGPAGSVTATLLAQEGFRVRLVESQQASTRVVAGRLVDEARRVQEATGGPLSKYPFDLLHCAPQDDDALIRLRVVTEPHLGLQRVTIP